jgi:muramoyltetrapeptide carboxypeptidase
VQGREAILGWQSDPRLAHVHGHDDDCGPDCGHDDHH